MTKGATWRKNLIRKAKTLQKRVLVMPDEDYRCMLEDRYKQSSTTDLTMGQLQDLVSHLDVKAGNSAKQRPSLPDAPARKIWALWQSLHAAGVVRDPSEAALNSYVKRMTRRGKTFGGVDSYRWLNRFQARDVIEALKKWQQRVGAA
ncbi:MAG: regulatory protein GemA [Pseudodesulfovibrio sp.]|uniref:regulatory protein GemA n=1 Tax=Pseudodesulfovibrio sp. TaxID=2035812 RepID=UPI003D119A31